MNGTCPIQVVEDRNNIYNRWLTLDKHIRYEQPKPNMNPNGKFENIVGWGRKIDRNIEKLRLLMEGHNSSPMYSSDMIRNPSIEEIMEINNILKNSGYKLNLKTYKLIKHYETNRN